MALKPCKKCGKETSTYLNVCRHCGARDPFTAPSFGYFITAPSFGYFRLILVFILIGGVIYLLQNFASTPSSEQKTESAQRVYDQSKLRKALRDWINRDNDEIDMAFSLSAHEMAGIEPGYDPVPIEPDFTIPRDTSHYLTQLYAQFAKRNGYVCDSISAAQNKVGDIRIWCNGGSYEYLLVKEGGQPKVIRVNRGRSGGPPMSADLRRYIEADAAPENVIANQLMVDLTGIDPLYEDVPVEPSFDVPDDFLYPSYSGVQVAAQLVKLRGHRCDSISSARLVSQSIMILKCNQFNNEYHVKTWFNGDGDKVSWSITVK